MLECCNELDFEKLCWLHQESMSPTRSMDLGKTGGVLIELIKPLGDKLNTIVEQEMNKLNTIVEQKIERIKISYEGMLCKSKCFTYQKR